MLTLAQAKEVIGRQYHKLAQRRPDAEKWMRYYRGEQGALLFASPDFQVSAGDRYKGFSDNWSNPVAAAGAERTAVRGIKLPGSELDRQSPEEKAIWGALQDNGIDAQLAQAFLQSGIQRRAFVSVWAHREGDPDAGKPLVSAESATQAIVEYDPEIRWRRRYGTKCFADDTHEYATLDDGQWIYKFRRPLGAVTGVTPSGLYVPSFAGADWAPIGEPIKNHLGLVTLVELPYLPPLSGDPLSVISGVAAMQDAVNLLWAYLFNAADYASLPGRVVMGASSPKMPLLDSNGQKIGERELDVKELVKGRIAWLTGDAKIGQWDAAQLNPFIEVIEQVVAHIAAQTRTPPHYLVTKQGMSNLSGDALKAAETGLVMKVVTSQEHYEGRLRDVAELVARQLNLPNSGAHRARIQWRDPENRSDAQKSDSFTKRLSAGYPFEWLLIEDGKSPDEIEMIMKMKAKEQEQALRAGVFNELDNPDAGDDPEAEVA